MYTKVLSKALIETFPIEMELTSSDYHLTVGKSLHSDL